jgi:signal transduction histidine kinase
MRFVLPVIFVQQIVLAHGGEIAVESNAQDGTTFTIRVPRVRPSAEPA